MPLYEYLCTACGHRFERIQKFSDAPIKECPACGGLVEKQISSPAIQFKGAGWYVTDYAKSRGSKESGAAKSGDQKSSETTTEAKTETKAKTDAGPTATSSSSSSSSDKSSSDKS